jgi:hypothetical protein
MLHRGIRVHPVSRFQLPLRSLLGVPFGDATSPHQGFGEPLGRRRGGQIHHAIDSAEPATDVLGKLAALLCLLLLRLTGIELLQEGFPLGDPLRGFR